VITRYSGPVAALLLVTLFLGPATPVPATAASGPSIERDARAALEKLYSKNPNARLLRDKAHGILVFPNMLKAGFMFGGQIGEGALFRRGKVAGFYNSVAASYGLQVGAQVFGYALFFMNESALAYLDKSEGFEVGSGPSLVVLVEGAAKSFTSTTITQDVYAFVFDQKGLMGGLGIQGSKITRVSK
jgi:lipid-binding SYLF domain-containing protein